MRGRPRPPPPATHSSTATGGGPPLPPPSQARPARFPSPSLPFPRSGPAFSFGCFGRSLPLSLACAAHGWKQRRGGREGLLFSRSSTGIRTRLPPRSLDSPTHLLSLSLTRSLPCHVPAGLPPRGSVAERAILATLSKAPPQSGSGGPWDKGPLLAALQVRRSESLTRPGDDGGIRGAAAH